MTDAAPRNSVAALVPAVRDFRTPQFSLRDDLSHLEAVLRSDAPEAVIFYSGRILEALANEALRRLGQDPSPNVFSNLQALEHFNRMSSAVRYWAHAQRRLGNLVRHIDGRVGPDEATLAALFAERLLEWFFCRLDPGHRLPCLTQQDCQLELADDPVLRATLSWLEQFEYRDIGRIDPGGYPAVLRTPVLLAVWAESLLSRGDEHETFRVLDIGIARFPNDLRLNQLLGVYWSRLERFDTALEWLQKAYAISTNDDETDGITAGVYKRQWLADRANTAALEESHCTYRTGWRNSSKKNPYPGINAAATALWLGNRADALRYAGEVEKLLLDRQNRLPPDLRGLRQDFSFWDQVTLAEARLLLGDWPTARQMYLAAFARFPEREAEIRVARDQARLTLEVMGITEAL